MFLTKKQRFDLFVAKLNEAKPVTTAAEALSLVATTLNGIEDLHSGASYSPNDYLDDGRMYPPLQDSARKVNGRTDVIRYRNRGHNTYIGANGAIRIQSVDGEHTIVDKAGQDNDHID